VECIFSLYAQVRSPDETRAECARDRVGFYFRRWR
jgi:hypothetical protein